VWKLKKTNRHDYQKKGGKRKEKKINLKGEDLTVFSMGPRPKARYSKNYQTKTYAIEAKRPTESAKWTGAGQRNSKGGKLVQQSSTKKGARAGGVTKVWGWGGVMGD